MGVAARAGNRRSVSAARCAAHEDRTLTDRKPYETNHPAKSGSRLFVLLTAALLAAADFLLVDDVHSYSRVMLQELYADAGNIDTLFLGSSHCYRSVDPAQVDAALGTHSFNAGSSQQLPDGSYYMLKEAAAQEPAENRLSRNVLHRLQ